MGARHPGVDHQSGGFVLIAAGIVFSGGEHLAFFLIFTLTTVFFAASYPVGGQLVLFVFTAAAYVGAVLLSGADAEAEAVFIHLGILGSVAFMASFLSGIAQLAEVRRLGCDHVQGFVFAPGIAADEVPPLVRRPVPHATGEPVVSG